MIDEMREVTWELSPTDFRNQLAVLDKTMSQRKHVIGGRWVTRLHHRVFCKRRHRPWYHVVGPLVNWWYTHMRYGPRYKDEWTWEIAREIDKRIWQEQVLKSGCEYRRPPKG